jgi:ABC-type lipoprotein release transport system permease subunit
MSATSLRIAWRNLWRHTHRTILMIAIVAFGSWVILVLWGLTDGFTRSMTNTQIIYNQGDLQLRAVDFSEDPVPRNGLTEDQVSAADAVLATVRTQATSPRLETYGLLRSSYGSEGVSIRGIDPLQEPRVTSLQDMIVEGRYITGPGEVMMPAELARSLDVRLGERVVLLAQGESGVNSQSFRAVGFFNIDLGSLNSVVIISLTDAQSLTEWSGLTAIAVKLPPGTRGTRVAGDIQRDLAAANVLGVEVADYFTLNPLARVILQGTTYKMIPFVVMISLMAGFGVANTAFYSVLERTREFGVMAAVGMSRALLARVVLMESVFVSAIGFLAGGGIGYVCLIYLSRHGISFGRSMAQFGAELGIPTTMYASTSGWYWVAAFSVVVFTALAAAWYPARRANRLEPVAAIRGD